MCMSANMRGNIGHLNLIDFIVPADHMIESVFPMHGYKWHSILIQKKESRVTVHHFFNLIIWPILNNCSKHLCHFICHWNNPCSGICFCWLNYILSFGSSLQLMINIDGFFSKSISLIVSPQNSEILIQV